MNDIKNRIRTILKVKGISRKELGEKLGWSITYMNRIFAKDCGVGLKPLECILKLYPDIDARWLILGEGYIFGDLDHAIINKVNIRMEMRKYIYVMSDEELNYFLDDLLDIEMHRFLSENRVKWDKQLAINAAIDAKRTEQ